MDTKWIALSKTVWGAVIMAGGAAAAMLDWSWFDMIQQESTKVFDAALVIVGFVLNVYGRMKATTKVTAVP